LTIWNKLKIETTHIVYRLNNVRVSQNFKPEIFGHSNEWHERAVWNSRRTARSKRSVQEYVSIASTAQRRSSPRTAMTVR
ncbi:hypothetical protein, partial [Providencia stuartii]|uniref:hypothetical protein n=1 Tax=Providencia stuartii TaxID=588 RepID=UPI0023B14ADB